MKNLHSQGRLWERSFSLIWSSVPGYTAAWAILLIVQGLLPGATVYFSKLAIDSFVASKNSRSFVDLEHTVWLFALTGITLLAADSLRYVTDWVRSAQAEHFSDTLKSLVHSKAVEVDFEFYDSPEYHDLKEQAGGESQSKPLALLENFGTVAQSSITLISFAALLTVYGWAVPILLVVGSLPSLLISLAFDRRYFRWWRKTATERRWLFYYDGMLSHSDAAAEIRLFEIGQKFSDAYQRIRKTLRLEKLKHLREQTSGKIAANFLALATGTVAMGWIALRVYNNTASFGDLAVFYQVFSRGQSIILAFLGAVGKTFSDTLYLDSLFAFLDLKASVVSPAKPVPFPTEIVSGIRFTNVTFSYPGTDSPAIADFDLFVPAGTQVAIVGENGAGKSTLIKLLCRFYDPNSGSIQIDGIDIREFDVKDLRRNISVLFQFPLHFQDTVEGNISLGHEREIPDPTEVETAAELAGADSFIEELPSKYRTLLGRWFEAGCELSGGEWQKIALARAYFRKSPILVLDEPTSFMDSWGEADWYERFSSLAKDRTGLVITHRFTIAMRADIIHVLSDSRLVESGTHKELVDMDGFYASSWKSQMLIASEKSYEAILP
ncbi:MAG: ABC transporter ATP-binding protein/permease [Pyrinomonadaceae bacterium]|nr:ABC transporter ATP-binding protein/permease [Pyrinomonadaceae bacterium]